MGVANDPAFRGYYINLDRAVERRRKIEAEVERLGLSGIYSRFPAVDAREFPKRADRRGITDGEVAIFRSHFDVLKEAAAHGTFVHVLEDDAILSSSLLPVMNFALKLGLFTIFDIVFLETYVPPDGPTIKTYRTAAAKAFAKAPADRSPSDFGLLDIELSYFLGAASYVVNRASIGRILEMYETEWQRGPKIPVDFLFRREIRAGRLRAGCVLPFLTSLEYDEATASQSGRRDNPDSMAGYTLIQKSFFVDRDLAALDSLADRLIARSADSLPTDEHAQLLYKLFSVFRI